MSYAADINYLVVISSVMFAVLTYIDKPLVERYHLYEKKLRSMDFRNIPKDREMYINMSRQWESLMLIRRKKSVFNLGLFLGLLLIDMFLYLANFLPQGILPMRVLVYCDYLIVAGFFTYSLAQLGSVWRGLIEFQRKIQELQVIYDISVKAMKETESAVSSGGMGTANPERNRK